MHEADIAPARNQETRNAWRRTAKTVKAQVDILEAQLTKLNQSAAARKELDKLLNQALAKGKPITRAFIKSIAYFITNKYN